MATMATMAAMVAMATVTTMATMTTMETMATMTTMATMATLATMSDENMGVRFANSVSPMNVNKLICMNAMITATMLLLGNKKHRRRDHIALLKPSNSLATINSKGLFEIIYVFE